MRIVDCDQASEEWCNLRRGIPTSSEFSKIVTPARGDLSKSSEAYMAELLAERTDLGWVEWHESDYSGSPDLQRGRQLEDNAREWFAFTQGTDVRKVGICLADCGRYAASPDGMTETDEPVELKAPRVKTHAKWLLAGGLPNEHKCQVHGQIFVTGAERGWFMSFVEEEAVKPLLVEVKRDEFTERLGEAVEEFCRLLEKRKTEVLEE